MGREIAICFLMDFPDYETYDIYREKIISISRTIFNLNLQSRSMEYGPDIRKCVIYEISGLEEEVEMLVDFVSRITQLESDIKFQLYEKI